MRKFISLKPEGLPESFDAEIHGEEPIVTIEESKGRFVISYVFPGFYLSDDIRNVDGKKTQFNQVNIGKTGFIAESGKPLLPSFGRYLQIPFDCNYKLTVKKGKPVQFDDVLILPAQQKLKDDVKGKNIFEYDKEFYSKSELYPENIVDVTGPFDIDGYNALLVHVRPIQYNPAKRKLLCYSSIEVTITISEKKTKSAQSSNIDSRLDKEAYGNMFLNPVRGVEDRVGTPVTGTQITVVKPAGPEFLIIYADIFKTEAERLAKWKNMRGLPTDTVSITTTGTTENQIKTYIRNKRKAVKSRLRYVLLFGDMDLIPTKETDGNTTDYYYSTQTDPIPGNYVLPWLSIGRIPVKTAVEGMVVVDQIISYEMTPPTAPEYYKRMTFAAYFQDDDMDGRDDRGYMATMETIRNSLIPLGLNIKRAYVSDNPNPQYYLDGTPVPSDVKAAIVNDSSARNILISSTNEGQLIIGHRDHGSEDGWYKPPFTSSNMASITSEVPSIFYSVNCLTGRFDSTSPKDCFAEVILNKKGAAPSLIAATEVSATYLNNHMIKALFDAMWAGVLATFPGTTASYPVKYNRLGDILNYGKSYLPVAVSGSPADIKDHFEIYHVIGDPTIELWKVEPLIIKISALIKTTNLDIMLSSCPKGSIVTVWDGDKLIKRVEPSSTHIAMSLKTLKLSQPLIVPVKHKKISVCFWAPGCRFQQTDVEL